MKEVRVEIAYRRQSDGSVSHTISEQWKETDYFCPCCGSKSVWNRTDSSDYYVGEEFMCIKCEADWNWPSEPSKSGVFSKEQNEQRLSVLREIDKDR
jgi:hypothetical protein